MLQKLQVFDMTKKGFIVKKMFFLYFKLADINNKCYLCSFVQWKWSCNILDLTRTFIWMKHSKHWHISDKNKWSAVIVDCMSFHRVRTFFVVDESSCLGENRITFRYWFLSALFICLSGRFDSCILTFVKVTHLPPGWPQSQSLNTGIRANSFAVFSKSQKGLLYALWQIRCLNTVKSWQPSVWWFVKFPKHENSLVKKFA